MKVIQKINNDGAKKVGIITDHVHQGGQGHFSIVICWARRDGDVKRTVKCFCPIIDTTGHTAQKTADDVKNVLDRFLSDDVVAEFIT